MGAILTLALALAAADARPCDWTGGGGDDNWSTAANWINCNGTAPVGGETLVFPHAASRKTNVNDLANLTVGQLAFTGWDYRITGNPIDLQFGIAVNLVAPLGFVQLGLDARLVGDQAFEVIGDPTILFLEGGIELNGSRLTIASGPDPGGFSLGGGVTGDGSIFKEGTGELRLSGSNTYTGATGILQGTLKAFTGNALGASGPANGTVISTSAAVQFIQSTDLSVGETFQVAGVGPDGNGALRAAGGGTVTLTGVINLVGDTAIAPPPESLIVAGEIVGAGGLINFGPGTLVLEGNNTYTGVTRASSGTLLINGSQPTSMVMVDGGVLGGTGTVGAVDVLIGSLTPGVSPGILSADGPVQFASGAIYDVELNAPGPGSGHDQLVVAMGGVNLDSPTLQATLGFAPAPGNELVLIDNQSAAPVQGTFAGLVEGATLTIGGQDLAITYAGGDGNDVVLRAADSAPPVPALPTVAAVALCLLLSLAAVEILRPRHG